MCAGCRCATPSTLSQGTTGPPPCLSVCLRVRSAGQHSAPAKHREPLQGDVAAAALPGGDDGSPHRGRELMSGGASRGSRSLHSTSLS